MVAAWFYIAAVSSLFKFIMIKSEHVVLYCVGMTFVEILL